jgi:hypothetical protein
MKHFINASDETLELENGQRIFPGQSYAKAEEEDEKPVKKARSKKEDTKAIDESTDAQ